MSDRRGLSQEAVIGQGAGAEGQIGGASGRGGASARRLEVVLLCGDGGVVGGVGAQVLEGLLALGHELFERRQQEVGGGRPSVDGAFGREGRALRHQAGAAAVGGVGALGASGASAGSGVKTPPAARTAVHRLQEETVSGVAARRAVGH